MKRKALSLALIATFSVALLSGCSPTPTPEPTSDTYSDENLPMLYAGIVETVCSVSGKQVMEKKDVIEFQLLAGELRKYRGDKQKQMAAVAEQVETTAANWEATLGADLGEENAQSLTETCDAVREAYGEQ